MEAIVASVTWSDWPASDRGIFQAFRSEAGESIFLDKNAFVENVLSAAVLRTLGEDEMDAYRAPFRNPGKDRRPTLTWPREIPVDGEPADVCQIVTEYGAWLAASSVPKLFINVDPGSILVGPQREWARSWPNQREVTVPGIHFVQEDSADAIGFFALVFKT